MSPGQEGTTPAAAGGPAPEGGFPAREIAFPAAVKNALDGAASETPDVTAERVRDLLD